MKIDKILLQIEKTKVPEFKITGNDIINHGIKNGPKIGEILKKSKLVGLIMVLKLLVVKLRF